MSLGRFRSILSHEHQQSIKIRETKRLPLFGALAGKVPERPALPTKAGILFICFVLLIVSSTRNASQVRRTSETTDCKGAQSVKVRVHNLFHFLLTSKELDWKMARSIETVFYHHPEAHVILHSNTLNATGHPKVVAFNEAGYNLQVRPFDMAQLLHEAASSGATKSELVQAFLDRIEEHKEKDEFWTNNESNLMRYLAVYNNRGIYLDLDMYVQQPIPATVQNTVGYEGSHGFINNAALVFEQQHDFMGQAINEFLSTYADKRGTWGAFGPGLITRLYNKNHREDITVLPPAAFQPLQYEKMKDCFETAGLELDLSLTYAFHTINKISKNHITTKKGTLCDKVYHQYCLLFCYEGHVEESDGDSSS